PGRLLRCGGANRFFVDAHVVIPELTFAHVRRRELPIFFWGIEALEKALLLLLARHIQKELEYNDSLASEILLEVCDIGEPFVPYARPYERRGYLLPLQNLLVHAHDQHFLVIRAVEYPDSPALGERLGVPPHEVVAKVLLRRLLE